MVQLQAFMRYFNVSDQEGDAVILANNDDALRLEIAFFGCSCPAWPMRAGRSSIYGDLIFTLLRPRSLDASSNLLHCHVSGLLIYALLAPPGAAVPASFHSGLSHQIVLRGSLAV